MRRLPLLTVVLLALLPAPSASAIVNGQTAAAGSWPWQVGVRGSDGTSSWQCGGTLVAPDRVVTAAHCTDGATSMRIYAGSSQRFQGEQRTATIADHPQADVDNLRYDVSLLTLASPVTTAGAKPVAPIAAENSGSSETAAWSTGADLTVTGWGETEGGSVSQSMREAIIDRWSDPACASAWGTQFRSADMLCALRTVGATTLDSCRGDSGGPLVAPVADAPSKSTPADWRLVGVVSWGGYPCADPDEPGVYARAAAPAINSFIRSTDPQPRPVNVADPVLSGDPRVGSTLICSQGSWSPAGTSYARSFYRFDTAEDTTPTLVGSGAEYVVTDGDAGRYVGCVVTASNSGGNESASSALAGPMLARATATPKNQDEPPPDAQQQQQAQTPSPILQDTTGPAVTAIAPDTLRPTARVTGRVCRRHRCRIAVKVRDRGGSGVRNLRARLTFRVGRVTKRVKVEVVRISATLFQIRTPRLRPRRYTLQLTAYDRANNRQRRATKRTFRVR